MKLEIKIKAFEASLADTAAKKIVEAGKKAGAKISGPVPLPTRRESYTVLRSVHVNKTSREQFESRTHKRLIVLDQVEEKLMDGLKRLELPAGVQVEVNTAGDAAKRKAKSVVAPKAVKPAAPKKAATTKAKASTK